MRTAYDLSPLYRSMIGVDRMADLIDGAMRREADPGGPPYDIEKTGDAGYRITLAVAGFAAQDLEVTARPNLLIVAGRKAEPTAEGASGFLHRGFAVQNFERRFALADHVVVKAAHYDHGLLSLDLARETPEALKPRRIEIAALDPADSRPAADGPQARRRAA